MLAVVVNAMVSGYCVIMLGFLLLGIGSNPPSLAVATLEMGLAVVLLHVPVIGVGLKTVAGRLWALWAGLGLSLALVAVAVGQILLPTEQWGGFHRDFEEKWNQTMLFVVSSPSRRSRICWPCGLSTISAVRATSLPSKGSRRP